MWTRSDSRICEEKKIMSCSFQSVDGSETAASGEETRKKKHRMEVSAFIFAYSYCNTIKGGTMCEVCFEEPFH
jgi:hypothetical protein